MRWNLATYHGDLAQYRYPVDKEFADLLLFLKHVKLNKRVYLSDVMGWNIPYPALDYDVYIICGFGEAINEDLINRLDTDPAFEDKHVILLTSQYYQPVLKKIKLFHVEHLHTIKRFFPAITCSALKDRTYNHGALSRRTTFHKSYALIKLRQQFGQSLQYSFCGFQDNNEYQVDKLTHVLLGGDKLLTHEEIAEFKFLHDNPVSVEGDQWSIENHIYKNSRLIWTLESMFASSQATAFLTEKIVKSIVSRSCFIMFSQKSSYRRLREMGFETFDKQISLDFDELEDSERFEKICDLMHTTDFDDWLTQPETQQIVDYNYNHFYNNFYDYVERANKEKIQTVIEYINAI